MNQYYIRIKDKQIARYCYPKYKEKWKNTFFLYTAEFTNKHDIKVAMLPVIAVRLDLFQAQTLVHKLKSIGVGHAEYKLKK